MANLSKIVECASQQAFDNIPQKDETVLYLTPENTTSIQAGNGIEVEKTTDTDGNEIYTISAIPTSLLPTDFKQAYEQGYNFNGRTIRFTKADYTNYGQYKVIFKNGYYLRFVAESGITCYAYNPDEGTETEFSLSNGTMYTFYDGSYSFGSECIVERFENHNGEITADMFVYDIQLEFEVED